jgi:ketosteroid isomerase-like protein
MITGMKTRIAALVLVLFSQTVVTYGQSTKDADALTLLLKEFLIGASQNNAAVHDRFWADDLIYTRSAGVRTTKAELMKNLRNAQPPKPDDPKTVYSAEDIQIHQYGDTAVVAFRLVATITKGGSTEVSNYLNTGTFVRRSGEWRAVAWQSTVMPKPKESVP